MTDVFQFILLNDPAAVKWPQLPGSAKGGAGERGFGNGIQNTQNRIE